MKKFLLITIGIILLNILTLNVSYAACTKDSECEKEGKKCIEGTCQDPLSILVPRIEDQDTGEGTGNPLKGLPDVTSDEVFRTAIKTILGASMLLTIAAIVIAAIYYIQSQGQEEDISKAKNIILYLVIGMAIMAAAYGLVSGIIQFKFFDAVS